MTTISIYQEQRVLAGDFELTPIIPEEDHRIIIGFLSYQDEEGNWWVNNLPCAIEYLKRAKQHHADTTPQRAVEMQRLQDSLERRRNAGNIEGFVRPSVAPSATVFPAPTIPTDITAAIDRAIGLHNESPDSHADIRLHIDQVIAGEHAELLNYYTKQEADTLLQRKADENDLATEIRSRQQADGLISNRFDQVDNAFQNEAALRVAGDDPQITRVNTVEHYQQVLAAQLLSNQPLTLVILKQILVDGQQYSEGEVLHFAPHSDTPEVFAIIPLHWEANLQHVSDTVADEGQWSEKTGAQVNSNQHLWLRVTKRFFATISGDRRAREVGELYHLPPRSTVASFIVDTSSQGEVTDIINTAIGNGVALWARGPGQNVDAQNRQAYPNASVFAPGFDNGEVLGTDGRGRLAWVSRNPFNSQQLAGLVNFTIEPGTVSRQGIAGNYTLFYDDVGVLGAAVYAAVQTPAATQARQRLVERGGSLDFTLDAAAARFIDNGTPAGASSFDFKVLLFDAAADGNQLATINLGVGIAR